VGFVGQLDKRPSHGAVRQALEMLERMTHRGACGCVEDSGDGAGILVGIPDAFLRREAGRLGIHLPAPGLYAVGQFFLPKHPEASWEARKAFAEAAHDAGHPVLGWRRVPVDASCLGKASGETEPAIWQVFLAAAEEEEVREGADGPTRLSAEQRMFLLRRRAEKALLAAGLVEEEAYICSLSTKTLVYKGQLTPAQVPVFYPDLRDPAFASHLALVHSRFSTNTFPAWRRAQPMRLLGHNGEINTLKGNKNWMRAREGQMKCRALGLSEAEIAALLPIVDDDQVRAPAPQCPPPAVQQSGRLTRRRRPDPPPPTSASRTRAPSTPCWSCSCAAGARCPR